MFPHEDERGCKFILLYPTRFDFRVLYLDQDLNLLEEKRANQSTSDLHDFKILDFINRPRTLSIYVRYANEQGFTVLALDKRTGELANTGLEIPEKSDVISLQAMMREEIFTVIQVEKNSSNLRIYESVDGYSYQVKNISLPIDNLHKRLRKGNGKDVPLITREGGNSLLTNYFPERFYAYGSSLSLVVDDADLGFAQRIDLDIENELYTVDSIKYPLINAEGPMVQVNSLLFEDLFVTCSKQAEGLSLAIYEFGKAEPTNTYHFESEETLAPYFFEIEAERENGQKIEVKDGLFEYLESSLIVSLEPNGNGDLWLMMGAYPHVSQNTQELIEVGFMVTSFVLGVGAGIQPTGINGVSFDPAMAVQSTGDIVSYSLSRYNKFVYRVGLLQANNLAMAAIEEINIPEPMTESDTATVPQYGWQKMEAFMTESEEYEADLAAQIIFPYKNGWVLGFGKKKTMYLHYFENE